MAILHTRRSLMRFTARAALWLPLLPLFPQPLRAGENRETPDIDTLVVLLRDLFPHHGLDDAFYRDIARAVRAEMDAAAIRRLDAGLHELDQIADNGWSAALPDVRRAHLKALENAVFFKDVYAAALEQVYRDPRVWRVIGYGGNAFAQGGYVTRGFNDIDWLPAISP